MTEAAHLQNTDDLALRRWLDLLLDRRIPLQG